MKTSRRPSFLMISSLAGCALFSALFILGTGCETEPVQDFAVSVSPQTVDVRKDQSQTFVASGGVRYTWSLGAAGTTNVESDATDPWGVLSATTGEQVTYTSLRSPEAGVDYVVRTLTVTATLGTDSGSNATARTSSTTAYIYHKP